MGKAEEKMAGRDEYSIAIPDRCTSEGEGKEGKEDEGLDPSYST